jgi:hypothetical protein
MLFSITSNRWNPARIGLVSGVLALALASPAGAARRAPITAFVFTSVASDATGAIAPDYWAHLIDDYVGAEKTIVAAAPTTLEACKAAGAAYRVDATFARLPKKSGDALRDYGEAHITVSNCITGTQSTDERIPLMSELYRITNEGDNEPDTSVTWGKVAPQLSKHPLALRLFSRVARLDGPFVYIDLPDMNAEVGGQLRIFADPKGALLSPPIIVVITQTNAKQVQAFLNLNTPGASAIGKGDFVEPVVTGKVGP